MKKQYKDSDYYIYDDGRCYSLKSKKFLTPQMSSRYPTYNLTLKEGKKKVKVHRMVAETFLENTENKEIVNHIDGDTHNFKLDNLEWATAKENSNHAVQTGLLPKSNQNGIIYYYEDGEELFPIKDYPNYLVSNYGKVINKNTKRVLKSCITNNGYQQVNLWKNNKGKNFLIHQLVYTNITQDYELKNFVINHKDGNKLNNNINNLEKITYQENNLHAEYQIKTHKCAKPIYQLDKNKVIIQEWASIHEAQRKTNINNISRALKTSRTAGGYYWVYKENI